MANKPKLTSFQTQTQPLPQFCDPYAASDETQSDSVHSSSTAQETPSAVQCHTIGVRSSSSSLTDSSQLGASAKESNIALPGTLYKSGAKGSRRRRSLGALSHATVNRETQPVNESDENSGHAISQGFQFKRTKRLNSRRKSARQRRQHLLSSTSEALAVIPETSDDNEQHGHHHNEPWFKLSETIRNRSDSKLSSTAATDQTLLLFHSHEIGPESTSTHETSTREAKVTETRPNRTGVASQRAKRLAALSGLQRRLAKKSAPMIRSTATVAPEADVVSGTCTSGTTATTGKETSF
jgi:hypothetical protein